MGVPPAMFQGIAAGTAASTENGLTADNPDFGQNEQDFQPRKLSGLLNFVNPV